MGTMGEGGTECDSKVQSLGTWAMAVLLAAEGKVRGSYAWMEGEFYLSMLHWKRSHSPEKRARMKASHAYTECNFFLKNLTQISAVLQSGHYQRLDNFPK